MLFFWRLFFITNVQLKQDELNGDGDSAAER